MTDSDRAPRAILRRARPFLAALAVYAAIYVVWTYPLVLDLTTHSVIRANHPLLGIAHNDQMMAISTSGRNAAAILDGDFRRLIHSHLCYPTPMSSTLGIHGIDIGILGLPAFALTQNPVLAYNTGCMLVVLIAALSAFALVRMWTGNAWAGFVSGLLFGFHASVLNDLIHPQVIGVHWMPLVLLGFERLLQTGSIRWAALLAVAISLQSWVGAYPMMVLVGFFAPFATVRLVQCRKTLDRRRLALVAMAAVIAAAAAGVILGSYAVAGSDWGVLHRRQFILTRFVALLPGGEHSVGVLGPILAALVFVFRDKGASPVPAIATGILSCLVLTGQGKLWPGGPPLGGAFPWLADRIWILGIARAPATIRFGIYLGVALLAGIGLHRAMKKFDLGPQAVGATAALVSAVILLECFHPIIGPAVFFHSRRQEVVKRAPGEVVLDAYRAFDAAGYPGPILELPYVDLRGPVFEMPRYVLYSAYHQRPTAACHNSHYPPSYFNVSRMAGRLPRPRAVLELAAIGLRNVVFYENRFPAWRAKLRAMTTIPGVEVVAANEAATSIRIRTRVNTHNDPSRLVVVGATVRDFSFQGYPRRVLDLEVLNEGPKVWALPHPISTVGARIRWRPRDGGEPGPWQDRRLMLPLALAGKVTDKIWLELGHPPKGCDCLPEAEVPELGWNLPAEAIEN